MAHPDDPIGLFGQWFAEAGEAEATLPEAVTLATAGADGFPRARQVLLKAWGPEGFVFYTNLRSRKARDLDENPRATLMFHWKSLLRQVRVEGDVERVSDEQADAYFASRARASRIGAWASRQSEPMEGRWEFEERVARFTARYAVGEVPRPPFWGGYRVVPRRIEFWEDRRFRLHLRWEYRREQGSWVHGEIYP